MEQDLNLQNGEVVRVKGRRKPLIFHCNYMGDEVSDAEVFEGVLNLIVRNCRSPMRDV